MLENTEKFLFMFLFLTGKILGDGLCPKKLSYLGKDSCTSYKHNVRDFSFSVIYLIRTNFRGHLISRIWNTNILRALIFAILQKMINLGLLISRKLTKDRLRKPFFY